MPEVVTVDEAAEFLRIGRNTMYAAVRRGEVPSKRIGGRILISKVGLMQMFGGEGLALATAVSGR